MNLVLESIIIELDLSLPMVYDYKVVRDENYESEVLHFTVREGSDEFTFVQVSDQ
jgi:hypothetical protein